ncbi:MAG: hypothetical protein DRH12_15810 [Deltaproteobacteria bacterium]|nr:MAG: hypothetical protein DRH12_15810 [Deltaproteobacteria bacterium]RLB84613.1 MAG: hypothetical protein DRH15_04515 [Deltaproteobacteria bacterium]
MTRKEELKKFNQLIQELKKVALKLNQMSDLVPSIKRNSDRVLASIRMMELNISDLVQVVKQGYPHEK